MKARYAIMQQRSVSEQLEAGKNLDYEANKILRFHGPYLKWSV